MKFAAGLMACSLLVLPRPAACDREMDPDGKFEMRTVLRRDGPDGFSAAREKREGSGWSPLFSVGYRREQSGSHPVGAP